MPIYVLGALNQRVRIPSQPLAVSLSGSIQHAALVVDASTEQRVMCPNPHLAVLPDLTQPVSIGVVCAPGTANFSADTVVNLAIGHDTPDDLDPVHVVFDPVDVGGLRRVELATLTPSGDGIEVSAGAAADNELTALASTARTSARKCIDRGTRAARGSLLLALDASASMSGAFASGTAAAATDIVVGVADALGYTAISAVLVGDELTSVDCPHAAGLAEVVAQVLPRWSAGARWSRLVDDGAQTIVCSDFPTPAVQQRFPVLAISDDPRLDANCVRMPAGRPGRQPTQELTADTAALDRITSALVRVLS
jgi:hypothetical protein